MSDLAAQITSLMALGPFAAVAAATGFTFSMTALGASFVYFIRDTHNQFMQSLTLGFAAGVMIAASIWSLLIPAIDAAEARGDIGWIPAAGGFVLGVAFLALLDKLLPHQHADSNTPEGPVCDLDKTTLLVFAVTLHNIPEGMSVGLTFAAAALTATPSPTPRLRRLPSVSGFRISRRHSRGPPLKGLRVFRQQIVCRGGTFGHRGTRFRDSHGRDRSLCESLSSLAFGVCRGRDALRRRGRTHPGRAP